MITSYRTVITYLYTLTFLGKWKSPVQGKEHVEQSLWISRPGMAPHLHCPSQTPGSQKNSSPDFADEGIWAIFQMPPGTCRWGWAGRCEQWCVRKCQMQGCIFFTKNNFTLWLEFLGLTYLIFEWFFEGTFDGISNVFVGVYHIRLNLKIHP